YTTLFRSVFLAHKSLLHANAVQNDRMVDLYSNHLSSPRSNFLHRHNTPRLISLNSDKHYVFLTDQMSIAFAYILFQSLLVVDIVLSVLQDLSNDNQGESQAYESIKIFHHF